MHRAMERWREDVGVHELGSRWQISIQFVEEYLCVIFFFFFFEAGAIGSGQIVQSSCQLPFRET